MGTPSDMEQQCFESEMFWGGADRRHIRAAFSGSFAIFDELPEQQIGWDTSIRAKCAWEEE